MVDHLFIQTSSLDESSHLLFARLLVECIPKLVQRDQFLGAVHYGFNADSTLCQPIQQTLHSWLSADSTARLCIELLHGIVHVLCLRGACVWLQDRCKEDSSDGDDMRWMKQGQICEVMIIHY